MSNFNITQQAALRLLTRRDHSQQELAQKLHIKGHASEDITQVIDHLLQAGLLNDARFAENYIHQRRRKGYGPKRIYLELQARGIIEEVIAEHLNITDNAWFIEVQHVWKKHFKGKLPTDFKAKAKQMRFLQYRGFTQEQIEHVLTTSS